MQTDTELQLPDWLKPPPELPKFPRTRDEREVEQMTFDALFERVLEALEAGGAASKVIKSDPRKVDVGRFMSWVRRDPVRLSRFKEAKKNGMMILEDRALEIATGDPDMPPEDVQRSKLQIDTIKWIMQAWDKERYGNDVKSSNTFSGNISVVIGEVQSPYANRDPLVLENGVE